MQFYFPIHIKSLDDEYYFREFNLYEYKELQKLIINNDYKSFIFSLEKIIRELCQKDINTEDIHFTEMLKIFLTIYQYSVDNQKVFETYKNGKKYKQEIKLNELVDFFDVQLDEKVFEFSEFSVVFGNMNYLYDNAFGPYDFLKYISIDGEKISYSKLSRKDFDSILDSLEFSEAKGIYEYIKDIIEKESNIKMIKLENKDGDDSSLEFNLDKKYLINLVFILCSDDLKDLYKMLFDLNQVLKMPMNDCLLLTQRESNIFIQLYNKKQEEEEKREKETPSKIPKVNF